MTDRRIHLHALSFYILILPRNWILHGLLPCCPSTLLSRALDQVVGLIFVDGTITMANLMIML